MRNVLHARKKKQKRENDLTHTHFAGFFAHLLVNIEEVEENLESINRRQAS